MARHFARAIAPSVPAAAAVLACDWPSPPRRTPAMRVGELVLYVAATLGATMLFERPFMREVAGYLRRRTRPAPA